MLRVASMGSVNQLVASVCRDGGQLVGPVSLGGQRTEEPAPRTGELPTVRVGEWALIIPQGEAATLVRIGTDQENLARNEEDSDNFGGSVVDESAELGEDMPSALGPTLHADVTQPCTRENGWFLVSLSEDLVDAGVPTAQQHALPSPRAQISQLCSELRRSLTPLLDQPRTRELPKQQRRPRQKRAPVTTPRRSVRLAKGGRGSKASKKQAMIIKKLCLANEGDLSSEESLKACVELFDKPQSWLCLVGTRRFYPCKAMRIWW